MNQALVKTFPMPVQQGPNVVPSCLLPDLFKRLDANNRLVVLDMGQAISSTVRYFSQYRCQLNFIDLYSEDCIALPNPDLNHQQKVDSLRYLLNLGPSTKIDICLFWDVFSYLDDSFVRALIEALEPNISETTGALIINPRDSRRHLPFYRYGISDESHFTQTENSGIQPPIFPRSQRDLNNLIDYFAIDRGRLMSQSRAEYLLLVDREYDKTDRSMI
jgi:hypothetical protein